MKDPADWQTAYDAMDMQTATAAELQAWVKAIQDDAIADEHRKLLLVRDAAEALCAELRTSTYQHYDNRVNGNVSRVVCKSATLKALNDLVQ